MAFKYPVYSLAMTGNEKKYVMDCLDSTWISSRGQYIQAFEEGFAQFIGVNHASSVCNGTVALHVALLALGIKPGDEIILPTFTYIASVNAIRYLGATPVFADSLSSTWQIDPDWIEKLITPRTKAVMAVHLYGHPCDMSRLTSICHKHDLFLIEDCAEAIGSQYDNRHVGTFGDISTFSFFGNKTITTGEGGMVVSNSQELIDKVNHLKNQGVSKVQYWHDSIGYNFRMTNICAAIGLAQLERVQTVIAEKIRIADTYRQLFAHTDVEFHHQDDNVFHSYWMCSILINNSSDRDSLREYLAANGIDTRPLFYPAHIMPMYTGYAACDYPVAMDISARGVNLPSYPELGKDDLTKIAATVLEYVARHG